LLNAWINAVVSLCKIAIKDEKVVAQIIVRESAIICGIEYAQNAFLSLDKNIQIEWQLNDGDRMDKNQPHFPRLAYS
jgi:nicotinate-nucleotide pyrophosphorylase